MQRLEEKVVSHEKIGAVADAVIRCAATLDDCLVWPVGTAAERVAGVIAARGRGSTDVGTWNSPVQGRRVLLFGVAAISLLELESAAGQLRSRGAIEVHACGLEISDQARSNGLDSYQDLCSARLGTRLALVDDAA